MSRAFVKERDDETVALPDRVISTHPNLVTEAGLTAIENTLNQFKSAHKTAVDSSEMNTTLAQFGHQVTIRRGDGRQQTLRIVGGR